MIAAALLSAAWLASPPIGAAERWPRPDARLKLGPLTIEVYVSRTAHRFHLVDQISAWDNACHGQYREHMELSTQDEAVLASYSEMRSKRRWGAGLEQTFYAPLEVEAAVREGLKAGHLTAPEAEVALAALEQFAGRADALMEERRDILLGAFASLDERRLSEAAKKLSRLVAVKELVVPAFPLSSPAPGGGGMDGGRLRWEIHSAQDLSFSVLLHEVTHGFLQQRDEDLRAFVDSVPGLNMTLAGEGFAYATAPGLYPDGETDSLLATVASDLAQGRGWGETTYEHQRMFGLALRPLLAEAFESGATLEQVLPRVRDVFLALQEVHATWGPPTLFTAGRHGEAAKDRLRQSKYSLSMYAFHHDALSYEERLKQARRGDLLVLLLAADDEQRIPEAFAHLCPVPPAEIERKIRAGRRVEAEHTTDDGLRVVLLAAPSLDDLLALVETTTLLEP